MIKIKELEMAANSLEYIRFINTKYLDWDKKEIKSTNLYDVLQEMIDDINKLIDAEIVALSAIIENKSKIIEDIKT